MAIKDILLTSLSYPNPTPVSMIEGAIALATTLNTHIAAISCETHVEVPGSFLSLGTVGGLIAAEAHQSRENAQALLAAFDEAAERAGVPHETILERCKISEVAERFVEYARLRDLTVVPKGSFEDQWMVEALIFGAGRPILLLPQISKPFELDTVLVGWDFGAAAARAVADAIPLLEQAKQVHILTVTNEKAFDSNRSAEELAKNLSRHGIDVVVDKVDAAGRPIGEVIKMHAAHVNADLLVTGAYGRHSRLREFVLGGVTDELLRSSRLPVLFSH
jgi:nucleotide-binding universal stress UspA family protein